MKNVITYLCYNDGCKELIISDSVVGLTNNITEISNITIQTNAIRRIERRNDFLKMSERYQNFDFVMKYI